MKTIVEIEWDAPTDKYWLCVENISLALHAYCTNTKFQVREVQTEILRIKELQTVLAKAQAVIEGFVYTDEDGVRKSYPQVECPELIEITKALYEETDEK